MIRERLAEAEARRGDIQRQQQAVALRLIEGDQRAGAEMKALDRRLAEVDGELATLKLANSAAAERQRAETAATEAARMAAARARLNELLAERREHLGALCEAVQAFESALARVAVGVEPIAAALRGLGVQVRDVSCVQWAEFERRLSMLLRQRLGRYAGLGVRRTGNPPPRRRL